MICIFELKYLLRGWYLIQKDGHAILLISIYEDLQTVLRFAHSWLNLNGIEDLQTMQQLIDSLTEHDNDN